MDHFETVEKLRTKANVSYEEARSALEMTDWDLLDALVYLENEGKVHNDNEPAFTTKKKPKEKTIEIDKHRVHSFFGRLFQSLVKFIRKCNRINFSISRRNETIIDLPMTAMIILLFFLRRSLIPFLFLLGIGLFFGFRYSIKGENVPEGVNRVMDKAAKTVEGIRSGLHNEQDQDDQS